MFLIHAKQNPRTIPRNKSTMSSSPPPEEREAAEAERKAKEDAEQAALPYKWTQTIKDVDVTISIDGKYKGRDLDVKISKTALRVAIKGQDPIIDVSVPHIDIYLRNPILTSSPGRAPPSHSGR